MSGTPYLLGWILMASTLGADPAGKPSADDKVQLVIDEVWQECMRDPPVFMIGRVKAKRLAELVRQGKPRLVVECGTALGYSGLWIGRELKGLGSGRLITIEFDPRRAKWAQNYFRKAGLEKIVTVKVGDARKLVREIEGPIDFAFIDCESPNYLPCLEGMQGKFSPGATIVADNAGIGGPGMDAYLKAVRSKYKSRIEWLDLELPWLKRDAMEISVVPGTRTPNHK